MLGEALLDAQHNPEIVLRALQLEQGEANGADSATVLAHVQSTVRGQLRTFTAPVRYRLAAHGRNRMNNRRSRANPARRAD